MRLQHLVTACRKATVLLASSGTVRRRHVFYVSGFDPNGPSRYHRLYADGARQQSEWGPAAIEVGPRKRAPGDPETMTWKVAYHPPPTAVAPTAAATTEATEAVETVETDYAFPRWDAIIRAHWWPGHWMQTKDLLRTSWQYLVTGAFCRVRAQGWHQFTTLFNPFLLLVLMLPGAAALLAAGAAVARAWHTGASLAGPLAAGLVVGAAALVWAYWARRYWHTQWVLRSYAFVGRMVRQPVPEMEARLDTMAAALVARVRQNRDDEVLVVGHSLGSIMAASVLARALAIDPQLAQRGPALGLLTLGHCLPLMSNLPAARGFRDELAVLAQCQGLCWVDFSDPLDDYAFPGIDPFEAAGVDVPRADHPQMRSPGFTAMMAAGPHQLPKMNLHQIHQQYLWASPLPQAYDYFAMTAGPLTLAARFATDRVASRLLADGHG